MNVYFMRKVNLSAKPYNLCTILCSYAIINCVKNYPNNLIQWRKIVICEQKSDVFR